MPTRGRKDPNGRALRGRRAHTTFASSVDPAAQIWSNYNVRSGAAGAATPEQPAVQNCLYDRFDALYKKSSIKPSLVIVPARFKSGTLYSEIPTSGAGDFTVTRATTATRVNASGLIESVASGIPRLDYFASGGVVGCPALLVEPSAQNQDQQSEDFSAGFHSKFNLNAFGSGSVANTTATLDPYGTNVADYIQENSVASITHGIIDVFAGNVSGTTFTWSVFAKAAERTIIQLFNNGGGAGSANFNLNTGVATLNTGVSCSMQNYGNGWWRCILSYTSTATGNHNVQIRLCDNSGNSTYNGMGNQGAYIFGAQLETGTVATSYIPTTTAAVTRSAEVITRTSASALIGQTEGTIYVEVDIRNMAKETYILRLDDGTVTNLVSLRTLSTNFIRTAIAASTFSGALNISSAAFTSGIVKIAFAYKSGDIAVSVNGATALTANGTFTFGAVLSRVNLGNNAGSGEFNDRIRAAALCPNRLTNPQLQALTAP